MVLWWGCTPTTWLAKHGLISILLGRRMLLRSATLLLVWWKVVLAVLARIALLMLRVRRAALLVWTRGARSGTFDSWVGLWGLASSWDRLWSLFYQVGLGWDSCDWFLSRLGLPLSLLVVDKHLWEVKGQENRTLWAVIGTKNFNFLDLNASFMVMFLRRQ